MNARNVLIITIVITFFTIIIVAFDWDRTFKIIMTPVENFIDIYKKKPHSSRRVVGVIKTEEPLNMNTVKSILDQSVRLNDIALESKSQRVPQHHPIIDVISWHNPNTTWLREPDSNTIIIPFKNNEEYSYGFVETFIDNHLSS
jgi:predicted RNA binding protein YcfA (HicA-like mRNA interferase family)